MQVKGSRRLIAIIVGLACITSIELFGPTGLGANGQIAILGSLLGYFGFDSVKKKGLKDG